MFVNNGFYPQILLLRKCLRVSKGLWSHTFVAAVDDRRQAAVDFEEQRPQLQDIFEAAINGNHV